jgi:hypothetical protein
VVVAAEPEADRAVLVDRVSALDFAVALVGARRELAQAADVQRAVAGDARVLAEIEPRRCGVGAGRDAQVVLEAALRAVERDVDAGPRLPVNDLAVRGHVRAPLPRVVAEQVVRLAGERRAGPRPRRARAGEAHGHARAADRQLEAPVRRRERVARALGGEAHVRSELPAVRSEAHGRIGCLLPGRSASRSRDGDQHPCPSHAPPTLSGRAALCNPSLV